LVATRCSLLADRYSLIADRYSLLADRYSLLAARQSLLAARSFFPVASLVRFVKLAVAGNNAQNPGIINPVGSPIYRLIPFEESGFLRLGPVSLTKRKNPWRQQRWLKCKKC
ncbi:MAG: hypothetical protein KDI06_13370, partial [Calditrichaeota bacterium]|nr:hypothetical protein [Calditrichota bacterium]